MHLDVRRYFEDFCENVIGVPDQCTDLDLTTFHVDAPWRKD